MYPISDAYVQYLNSKGDLQAVLQVLEKPASAYGAHELSDLAACVETWLASPPPDVPTVHASFLLGTIRAGVDQARVRDYINCALCHKVTATSGHSVFVKLVRAVFGDLIVRFVTETIEMDFESCTPEPSTQVVWSLDQVMRFEMALAACSNPVSGPAPSPYVSMLRALYGPVEQMPADMDAATRMVLEWRRARDRRCDGASV
jgi:hypothetical protein